MGSVAVHANNPSWDRATGNPTGASLCLATADAELRRCAHAAFAQTGHHAVDAASLDELGRIATAGVDLAIVDPRLPGIEGSPEVRLRAEPALHSCPILLLTDTEVSDLSGGGSHAQVVPLLVRVELQLAGTRQIAFIHDVNQALTASSDEPTTMQAVLDAAAEALSFDTASLFLLEPPGRLRVRAAWGYALSDEQLRSYAVGEGLVGWVVQHGVPSIVGDSRLDARFAPFSGGPGRRSILAAPIMIGERVLGALTVVRRDPAQPFTDNDLLYAATICNSAAVALEYARLREEEKTLADHLQELDALYGQEKAIVDKLDAYDRLYTQVVATVSHELKTPLMGILGFAELIRDGLVGIDEAREFAAEIYDNAVRLGRYAQQILEEDAAHHGRASLALRDLPLKPLVAEVMRSLQPMASARHTLVNEVPDDTWVSVDDDKITRVLFNLVSNAIKYSPDGGAVRVGAQPRQGHIEVVVADQGLGVPADAQDRIFDRYYRVSSKETRRIAGTGLGLSIVRGLVELHGGRVWVESAAGEGSRFCVTLPRGAAPSIDITSSKEPIAMTQGITP